MPALPACILEPLWEQFIALLPKRHDTHPLGCHRPRIPDRVIFDKLIQVLVFGCGYRRIADHTCSATTLRRRRDEWISAGVAEHLRLAVLAAYQRLFGLDLEHLAVDGCITKAPCGGQVAGPSPVDRRKQGLKRSIVTDAGGIPLGAIPAAANRRDDGLLAATLDATRPSPPLRSARCLGSSPFTRTHAWADQYGKLRWCTERRQVVVAFWLLLALALIVVGRLVPRAWTQYGWEGHPRRP
jgi:transposase